MSNVTSECYMCGRESSGLITYTELTGVRPCKIQDVNAAGQIILRDSMEPFYKDGVDLCYNCYRTMVRKERLKLEEEMAKIPEEKAQNVS